MLVAAPLLFGGSSFETRAQQTLPSSVQADAERGVELYRQGDDNGAIEALLRVVVVRGDDIAAWHFLGLAYGRKGNRTEAQKAHEKAVVSAVNLLERLYSSDDSPPVKEKTEALLELAAESNAEFVKLNTELTGTRLAEWNERTELLRDYARLVDESGNPVQVYTSREVETKAKITSRPLPLYPRGLRGSGIQGTIVIRAVFAADGKVKSIRVVSGLPGGVNQSVIQAARHIKFIPATLNGKPVAQRIQIEYNFQLY
ncbi:MAG TPA: TonB family protein [Pyrinomonadaceae bacterium]|nr:TonB family protein [Pyrinomonadaceae bacterium]